MEPFLTRSPFSRRLLIVNGSNLSVLEDEEREGAYRFELLRCVQHSMELLGCHAMVLPEGRKMVLCLTLRTDLQNTERPGSSNPSRGHPARSQSRHRTAAPNPAWLHIYEGNGDSIRFSFPPAHAFQQFELSFLPLSLTDAPIWHDAPASGSDAPNDAGNHGSDGNSGAEGDDSNDARLRENPAARTAANNVDGGTGQEDVALLICGGDGRVHVFVRHGGVGNFVEHTDGGRGRRRLFPELLDLGAPVSCIAVRRDGPRRLVAVGCVDGLVRLARVEYRRRRQPALEVTEIRFEGPVVSIEWTTPESALCVTCLGLVCRLDFRPTVSCPAGKAGIFYTGCGSSGDYAAAEAGGKRTRHPVRAAGRAMLLPSLEPGNSVTCALLYGGDGGRIGRKSESNPQVIVGTFHGDLSLWDLGSAADPSWHDVWAEEAAPATTHANELLALTAYSGGPPSAPLAENGQHPLAPEETRHDRALLAVHAAGDVVIAGQDTGEAAAAAAAAPSSASATHPAATAAAAVAAAPSAAAAIPTAGGRERRSGMNPVTCCWSRRLPYPVCSLAAADLDSDGRRELVVITQYGVHVLRRDPTDDARRVAERLDALLAGTC
ncbi:unnamed protein product [Phaeothamnion confervicola]